MKSLLGVCLIAAGMVGLVVTQLAPKPALQQGILVKMPVASEAVAMPAADEAGATIVTLTADGKLFLGTQPVSADALARVPVATVYVKAAKAVLHPAPPLQHKSESPAKIMPHNSHGQIWVRITIICINNMRTIFSQAADSKETRENINCIGPIGN